MPVSMIVIVDFGRPVVQMPYVDQIAMQSPAKASQASLSAV